MLDIDLSFSGSFDSLPVFEFKPDYASEPDAEARAFHDICEMFKYSGRVDFAISCCGEPLESRGGLAASALMRDIKNLLRYLESEGERAELRLPLNDGGEAVFRFEGSGAKVQVAREDTGSTCATEREILRENLETTLITFVKLTRKLCPNIFRDPVFQHWLR